MPSKIAVQVLASFGLFLKFSVIDNLYETTYGPATTELSDEFKQGAATNEFPTLEWFNLEKIVFGNIRFLGRVHFLTNKYEIGNKKNSKI